jgi:polyhydroxyalkanoate synthesis repressor PhaR
VDQKRIIKRYSNRKLYDTQESRYITIAQIGEFVKRGEEVCVIDNASKDDLTEVILAQVLVEEQKGKKSVPIQALRDLLHERTEGVLTSLREGPIGRLIPTKRDKDEQTATEKPAEKTAERPTEKPARVGLVDQAKGTFEEFQHRVDERINAVLPSVLPWRELEVEVARLKERVAELEAQVSRLEGRK